MDSLNNGDLSTLTTPHQLVLSHDLCIYILRDAALAETVVQERFLMGRWGRGDLADMEGVEHPARYLLYQYQH